MTTKTITKETLIGRYVRKGGSESQATALLERLHREHEGWNLHYALCYWDFATEATAERYVFAAEGK